MLYELCRLSVRELSLIVLILILMEYALRGAHYTKRGGVTTVLILILMEYALRVKLENRNGVKKGGLNPYSNGICSTSNNST